MSTQSHFLRYTAGRIKSDTDPAVWGQSAQLNNLVLLKSRLEKTINTCQALVALICNSNYSRGKDQEDCN
jgi:hypothetical protein